MDKTIASDKLRIGPFGSTAAIPPLKLPSHPFLLWWVYPWDHRHGCPIDQFRTLCNTFSHSALTLHNHHAPFQLMANFDEGIMFRPLKATRYELLGRTNFPSSLLLRTSLPHEWHLTDWLAGWLAGWLILVRAIIFTLTLLLLPQNKVLYRHEVYRLVNMAFCVEIRSVLRFIVVFD